MKGVRQRLTTRKFAFANALIGFLSTKWASRRKTSFLIRTSLPSPPVWRSTTTTRWIKANLPHAKVSGGVSNISFSFRGNNKVREAMHSAFLYHAIAAGMDMGIVNAGMLEVYEEIEPELKVMVEDVLLNRRPDATERLVDLGERLKAEAANASGEATTE